MTDRQDEMDVRRLKGQLENLDDQLSALRASGQNGAGSTEQRRLETLWRDCRSLLMAKAYEQHFGPSDAEPQVPRDAGGEHVSDTLQPPNGFDRRRWDDRRSASEQVSTERRTGHDRREDR